MKTKNLPDIIVYFVIALTAALLFIPFLGGVHLFDWDEINFAESAREMIVSGDYMTVQVDYMPFWEKPPLFIWMQVLSIKIFGVNEFAARFPNAVCGIITLLILYSIGRKNYDRAFGLFWVLTYAGSLLPFLYFKSGIIDPWFNLFIFLGIFKITLYFALEKGKLLNISLAALFIGLAILTKGPVALLIFLLTVLIYCLLQKFRIHVKIKDILLFTAIIIVTGGFWFLLQIIRGNFSVIVDFIEYQVHLFQSRGAGHGGFPLYHVIVLMVGVFPASLLAVPGLFHKTKGNKQQITFTVFMKILFWTVLILFSIVKTKIVHYSSLCYFPLTYFAALILHNISCGHYKPKKILILLMAGMAMLYALTVAVLPFIDNYKSVLLDRFIIDDPFVLASINADAGWKGFEGTAAIVLVIGTILLITSGRESRLIKGLSALFVSFCLFTLLCIIFFTPRIERYSQHAAIEFFKSVSHEDAYVETLGYKSYAHLFYAQKKPSSNPGARSKDWLLTGNIDKKVYLSMKTDKKDHYLSQFPELKFLYEKNGFVFCIREIP
ncbi:MAG: glycosyltransferase family 39 protein [Bacteroidales bacterium]|nr:glycosyltransferase family 39 protein [Bacteroidales bacterium]MBN2762955.1 glycosyltransferase family 39 protein [Bacteroidales bacterium]